MLRVPRTCLKIQGEKMSGIERKGGRRGEEECTRGQKQGLGTPALSSPC